jgi:hypothetical protein
VKRQDPTVGWVSKTWESEALMLGIIIKLILVYYSIPYFFVCFDSTASRSIHFCLALFF